jgi:hypothetical protein
VVATPIPATVRFWRKVEKQPGDGCWLWTGTKVRGRYGHFQVGTRSRDPKVYSHVFAWTEANGPVPHGKELDHYCNTPACVRPDEKHVRPLTHRENRARSRLTVCRSGRHEITDETARWDKDGNRRGCLACWEEAQARRPPRRR